MADIHRNVDRVRDQEQATMPYSGAGGKCLRMAAVIATTRPMRALTT
jgi:hypothetical protein